MNESVLKQALTQTADEMIFNEFFDCENVSFTPSNTFNKKIDKLCKSYDKITFKLTYTRLRKTVCVFVAVLIILLSSLTVGAVRNAIANFFVEHFSNHAVVTYNEPTAKAEQYPETVEKVYELDGSYGFELVDFDKAANIVYSFYTKDEYAIVLKQYTKKSYSENIDNEQSKIDYETINGREYIVKKIESQYDIIFDNGEYIFSITSNLDKDNIIDIFESLKIKK